MNSKLLLIVSLPLIISLSSCLPDPLEVKNIPDVKPEIVVNSLIVSDGSLVVFLTKTFGALEASDNSDPQDVLDLVAVDDATVIIEGPGGMDTLRFLGTGLYGGIALTLTESEEYNLYVKSESLGEVQATTTVQPKVPFESIEAQRYFNGYDDTLVQVTYTIKDPLEKNQYMINVERLSLKDPIEEHILNPSGFTKLLNDDDFAGQKIGGTFRAFPRNYAAGDTVAVLLSNISPEYYNFIQLRLNNRFSFVEFVSEPVNYPSNIVGGRGLFNLYLPDVHFFVLD